MNFHVLDELDLTKNLTLHRAMATLRLCMDIQQNGGTRTLTAREIDTVVGTGRESKYLRTCLRVAGPPNKRHGLGLTWEVDKNAVRYLMSRIDQHRQLVELQQSPYHQFLDKLRHAAVPRPSR